MVLDESPVAEDGKTSDSTTLSSTVISGLFDPVDYGNDGAGSVAYKFEVTDGVGTGLWLTGQSGAASEIKLVVSDGGKKIEGLAGGAGGTLAFTLTIDGTTGAVTVTMAAGATLDHPSAGIAGQTPDFHDDAVTLDGLVKIRQTITDGDDDTDTAVSEKALDIEFQDDGPDVVVGNLQGTGTGVTQVGTWSPDWGNDGKAATEAIAIALQGVTIDGVALTQTELAEVTFERTSAADAEIAVYEGELTADLGGDGKPDLLQFRLVMDPDGTYSFDLVGGFTGDEDVSSEDGVVTAGGPVPIEVFQFDTGDAFVFYGVNGLVDGNAILGSGLLDISTTETLEDLLLDAAFNGTDTGGVPIVGTKFLVNASTTSIGSGSSNVITSQTKGTFDAGEPDVDEGDNSFILNPSFDASSVTVVFSTTNGGYFYGDGGTWDAKEERLYYTIYYADGDVSDPILVTDSYATKDSPQTNLVIGPEADKQGVLIDAVQFTIYEGTVKIPAILVGKPISFAAVDVEFDFEATLMDGDGDTSKDTFTVDLHSDALDGDPQIELVGVDLEHDSFNIDVSATPRTYEISGSESTDAVVLANWSGETVLQAPDGTITIGDGTNDIVVTFDGGTPTTTVLYSYGGVVMDALQTTNGPGTAIAAQKQGFVGKGGGASFEGGVADDHFIFMDAGASTVANFKADGTDMLMCRAGGFGLELEDGVLSADNFTVGAGATTADHYFVFDDTTDTLYFDADGSGAGAQVVFIQFATATDLTEADILIFT